MKFENIQLFIFNNFLSNDNLNLRKPTWPQNELTEREERKREHTVTLYFLTLSLPVRSVTVGTTSADLMS
jgi:hypothetical protein